MAVYFVTGKLGSGKTLAAVGRIREYLEVGRPVATNLDLNLDAMLPRTNTMSVTRLPDKPRAMDLEALGDALPEYDESKFGLIVLDECATWLNSRNWNDKERVALIEWFRFARKHFWDVIFIVQDIESVDKQLRASLCEHLVVCRRLDRLPVPGIGFVTSVLTLGLMKRPMLPKIHVGTVYYGTNEQGMKCDRWVYRGRDLYGAYQTTQVFRSGDELLTSAEGQTSFIDMRASYTMLSSAHLHQTKPKRLSSWATLFSEAGRVLLLASIWATSLVSRKPMRAIARSWNVLKRKSGTGAQPQRQTSLLRLIPTGHEVAVASYTATKSHK